MTRTDTNLEMGVAEGVDVPLFLSLGLFGLITFLGGLLAAAAPLV